jgi:hypothetical protein
MLKDIIPITIIIGYALVMKHGWKMLLLNIENQDLSGEWKHHLASGYD